jgi:hypothetical protein
MEMEDGITLSKAYTSYDGPDAVTLFRATTIRSALKLLMQGIKPTRNATFTSTLILAGNITGKKYKNKRTEVVSAIDDLTVWIETMKSALPIEVK